MTQSDGNTLRRHNPHSIASVQKQIQPDDGRTPVGGVGGAVGFLRGGSHGSRGSGSGGAAGPHCAGPVTRSWTNWRRAWGMTEGMVGGKAAGVSRHLMGKAKNEVRPCSTARTLGWIGWTAFASGLAHEPQFPSPDAGLALTRTVMYVHEISDHITS